MVAARYVQPGMRVAIVDDFLATARPPSRWPRLWLTRAATPVVAGFLVEKLFQGGRAGLEALGIPVATLAQVARLQDGKVIMAGAARPPRRAARTHDKERGSLMLFNSIYYAFFLPLVVALYWVVPRRVRYPLLLVASYLFYMNWIPVYLGLILALTVVNYGFGLLLGRDSAAAPGWRSPSSSTSACLAYFKYANFFIGSGARRRTRLRRRRISCCRWASRSSPSSSSITWSMSGGAARPCATSCSSRCSPPSSPPRSPGRSSATRRSSISCGNTRAFNAALAGDGVVPDPARAVQEGGAGRQPGAHRQPRLRPPGRPGQRRHLDRGLCLRVPDLLRLFRLYRHRARVGAAVRLHRARELRRAVSGAQPGGLLAALAYLAVVVAARLPVHPAGRLAAAAAAQLPQPVPDHGAGRPLARRGLALSCSGARSRAWGWRRCAAGRGRRLRAGDPFPCRAARRPLGALARAPLGALAVAATFHFTCLGWVLFRAPTLPAAADIFGRLLWPQAGAPVFDAADRLRRWRSGLVTSCVVGRAATLAGRRAARAARGRRAGAGSGSRRATRRWSSGWYLPGGGAALYLLPVLEEGRMATKRGPGAGRRYARTSRRRWRRGAGGARPRVRAGRGEPRRSDTARRARIDHPLQCPGSCSTAQACATPTCWPPHCCTMCWSGRRTRPRRFGAGLRRRRGRAGGLADQAGPGAGRDGGRREGALFRALCRRAGARAAARSSPTAGARPRRITARPTREGQEKYYATTVRVIWTGSPRASPTSRGCSRPGASSIGISPVTSALRRRRRAVRAAGAASGRRALWRGARRRWPCWRWSTSWCGVGLEPLALAEKPRARRHADPPRGPLPPRARYRGCVAAAGKLARPGGPQPVAADEPRRRCAGPPPARPKPRVGRGRASEQLLAAEERDPRRPAARADQSTAPPSTSSTPTARSAPTTTPRS